MENIEMKTEGNTLTLKIDISKNLGRSKTGKSLIVASTAGFVPVNQAVSFNLNVIKKG